MDIPPNQVMENTLGSELRRPSGNASVENMSKDAKPVSFDAKTM
jgi:hypothetical protein